MGQFTDLIAHDASYSLHDAIDSAASDYSQDFQSYWGLTSSEPPKWIEYEEWRKLRQLHGLAQNVANVASTLLRRKGLGAAKLAEPSVLADDARALQEKVDEALAIIRERVGIDAWGKAYWNLLPQQASDPRTRNAIFRNSLELECAELFVPTLGG